MSEVEAASPTEFSRDQRLKSVERAQEYWQTTLMDNPSGLPWITRENRNLQGPLGGDRLMMDMLDAIEESAVTGFIADFDTMQSQIAALGDYIADHGGATGPFGQKVSKLLAHMGQPSEGIPDLDYNGLSIPYDYFYWLETCNRLNGVGELGAFKSPDEAPAV
jgi:hypothetical protein